MRSRPTVQTARRSGSRTAPTQRSAVVISHGPFCLDGMAAAVCLGRFYGESRLTPIFAHPSEVDRVIQEVARASKPAQDLWITDITWKDPKTEKQFKELIRAGWRIFWIDHHTIAIEKSEEEIGALGLTGWVASNRFSAARLLYDYLMSAQDLLGRAPPRLKQFEKAVLWADDNDRWLHTHPGSRKLALTVAALGGMDAYRELLNIGSHLAYSPRMQAAYRKASRELSESIALAKRTRLDRSVHPTGLKIVAAICKGYTSEVADALGRDAVQQDETQVIFMLYNLDDQRISIRKTPSCHLNLSRLAGRFGGGGHPSAAGFEMPEAQDYLQGYLIDRLKGALEASNDGRVSEHP